MAYFNTHLQPELAKAYLLHLTNLLYAAQGQVQQH